MAMTSFDLKETLHEASVDELAELAAHLVGELGLTNVEAAGGIVDENAVLDALNSFGSVVGGMEAIQ